MQRIQLPATKEELSGLRAGDSVLISGTLHTGRDAAHKKLIEMILNDKPLPLYINAIYYSGPCPAPEGRVIGSCGPTTSGRMDSYAPKLIERGLNVMIGKGERSEVVIEYMKKYGAVYFAAVGGAGALLANCVKQCRVVAFPELGAEAIHELYVVDFPVIVAIDSLGNNLYKTGKLEYQK